MKAIDILEHFLSQAGWIDRANTVDRIILGDGEKEIKRVLVSWMSTLPAVRYAIDNGFDMLMTHEPTFWIHANEVETLDAGGDSQGKKDTAALKRGLIGQSGLVVVRNHDVWDRYPAVGIPWALARFLGIMGQPAATGNRGYQFAFDIEPETAGALAARFATHTATLGEPVLQLFGPADRVIHRLGIGTGCCCNPDVFHGMGCDGAVVCDDGAWYWRDIAWALDAGMPLIRMGHGTSEEPGMATLTEYINKRIPGVSAGHYPLSLGVVYVRGDLH